MNIWCHSQDIHLYSTSQCLRLQHRLSSQDRDISSSPLTEQAPHCGLDEESIGFQVLELGPKILSLRTMWCCATELGGGHLPLSCWKPSTDCLYCTWDPLGRTQKAQRPENWHFDLGSQITAKVCNWSNALRTTKLDKRLASEGLLTVENWATDKTRQHDSSL